MEWLKEARGVGLLWEEERMVRASLERVFGDYLLQIGAWGEPDRFLTNARTRNTGLFGTHHVEGVTVVSRPEQLAIADDSVDAVLLPHTLETVKEPHQLLREIDRILIPDGKLIVLGFNSPGWWAARQRMSDGGFLPGVQQLVGQHRLSDWLSLLGFTVDDVHYYHPAAPVDRVVATDPSMETQSQQSWWSRQLAGGAPEQRGVMRNLRGWRRWRITAAAYLMEARKEVAAMTPLKPRKFGKPRLVGGLVNPTTRNIANLPFAEIDKPE